MRNGVLLVVTVILEIATNTVAQDQIRLKSRQFVPQKGISAGAQAVIEGARGGKAHVLIQLDRKMTRPYRKSLEAQGVQLLGYIPERAWLAAVDSRKAEDIAAIPGVRAVCEIEPQDKIAPSIRKVGINAHSTTEEGRARLLVMFFGDVSMTEASGIIAGYGGEIVGQANILRALVVHLDIQHLWDLAAEDCVKWIDQHYEVGQCNDGARSAVGANTVQAAPYNLTGDGVVVGVWDAGCIVTDHNDLQGRVTDANCGGAINEHATHVTGTIMGDGSIDPDYKGMAPDADAVAYKFWNSSARSVSGNLLRRNHFQSVVPRRIHVSPLILFGQAKSR